jgi:hypothetical protein
MRVKKKEWSDVFFPAVYLNCNHQVLSIQKRNFKVSEVETDHRGKKPESIEFGLVEKREYVNWNEAGDKSGFTELWIDS